MKPILLSILLILSVSSCEKVFLGEDEANTPENNFELFWTDIDEHYGLFLSRGWDWDSIYTATRPRVNAQTTETELWNLFKEMLAYLDDSHTFLYNPASNEFFASGSEEDEQVEKEFSMDLLRSKYLDQVTDIPVSDPDDHYLYGKILNKDIGYIYLNGMESDNPDLMDDVLGNIGGHKAIILDIRNNFGGDDLTAADIAGRFADGEHFIYTVQERNGPEKNDFAEKQNYYTKPLGKQNFTKPVIVLTDKITVSAAEIFMLHMNAFAHVTQIGDNTAGDFSDIGMRRFLPNGWQYQYSIMMFLTPDGQSLDGIGHTPDIYIRNSEADILAGNDRVLERAIHHLFTEYGIE